MKLKVEWKKFSVELPVIGPGRDQVSVWKYCPFDGFIFQDQWRKGDRPPPACSHWGYCETPEPPNDPPQIQLGDLLEYVGGKGRHWFFINIGGHQIAADDAAIWRLTESDDERRVYECIQQLRARNHDRKYARAAGADDCGS